MVRVWSGSSCIICQYSNWSCVAVFMILLHTSALDWSHCVCMTLDVHVVVSTLLHSITQYILHHYTGHCSNEDQRPTQKHKTRQRGKKTLRTMKL